MRLSNYSLDPSEIKEISDLNGIIDEETLNRLNDFLFRNEITFNDFCERWKALFEIMKVDLKFHQLDDEGYYNKLLYSNQVDCLFSNEEIERAMVEPPSDTRAHVRGELIKAYGIKNNDNENNFSVEREIRGFMKIGWNKFYLSWPWKRIQFEDPFNNFFKTSD